MRERFAKSFRYIVCQRLLPKTDRSGRVAAFEILKANARTRECIEKGEREDKTLLDAMKAGSEKACSTSTARLPDWFKIALSIFETGLSFATNPAISVRNWPGKPANA